MTGDLLSAVDQLLAQSIPLVIIGGHAVNAHGVARSTEDIDVVFRRDVAVEQRLFRALSQLHAFWLGDEIDPSTGLEREHPVTLDFIRNRSMIMVGTDRGYLDLFDHVPLMPDASVDELIADSIILGGRPYASLMWLRDMKAASGRPIDLQDLESLPKI